jgi:hypothetical protein
MPPAISWQGHKNIHRQNVIVYKVFGLSRMETSTGTRKSKCFCTQVVIKF